MQGARRRALQPAPVLFQSSKVKRTFKDGTVCLDTSPPSQEIAISQKLQIRWSENPTERKQPQTRF